MSVCMVFNGAIVAHMKERQTIRFHIRPFVADIDADIVVVRNVPAEPLDQILVAHLAGKHAGRLIVTEIAG